MATLKNTLIDDNGFFTLPVGTEGQRPSNPTIGMMRYNTESESVEVYNGEDWKNIGDTSSGSEIYSDQVFETVANQLRQDLNNFKNNSFYNYRLDGGSQSISDGGGDMYDGGNRTQLRVNGSNVTGDIDYNDTNINNNSNVKWSAMGYPARPLMVAAISPTDQNTRFGWSRNGNNGADGGGSTDTFTPYNGDTVNGFTVYSWVNEVYSAGDPSIVHLYATIGHPSWNSSFSSYARRDRNANTDSDFSQYETNATNCLNITLLLSKDNGNYVSSSECRQVLDNITSSIGQALGI